MASFGKALGSLLKLSAVVTIRAANAHQRQKKQTVRAHQQQKKQAIRGLSAEVRRIEKELASLQEERALINLQLMLEGKPTI